MISLFSHYAMPLLLVLVRSSIAALGLQLSRSESQDETGLTRFNETMELVLTILFSSEITFFKNS